MRRFFLLLLSLSLPLIPSWAGEYPWQHDYATVVPSGDLLYAPEPFIYVAGDSQRHIDYEQGDDRADGSRENPWKHHPWDPNATANAKAAAHEVHTYLFKGGVTYRGRFVVPPEARGSAENPIRLTRDPSWGEGPAVINGARVITGWKQGAHPKMPEPDKIWMVEIDFLPRTVWLAPSGEEPTRLDLARWPNWTESDPMDPMVEWPTWDQPQWWTRQNRIETAEHGVQHLGVAESLPRPLSDLEGGTVWTEWGIVMGSPYPAKIVEVSEERGGIAFRGPWTFGPSEQIITGNRYYLEDLPQFLDAPGQFWVERLADDRARLYLRMPDDSDPNDAVIEAGVYHNIFEGTAYHHIHWTGLTFRFGNVGWHYNDPRWAHPDLSIGCIYLDGEGDGILIAHNHFEHVMQPVRISVEAPDQTIGSILIHDNRMRDTDHGAITIHNATPRDADLLMGRLEHVEIFRNQLERIGWRILSGEHGHAIDVRYPETSHIAGNFLQRIAGWGIAVFGGKPSGENFGSIEAPLSRHLIHQNRVEDVLLKTNDWGGIETWQGGSHYIFDNVVINALGFKNWTFTPGDATKPGSFGHAYYLDGSFKNYLFNNIGLGINNALGTKGVNLTAIQGIFSFENWFFNNTFHRFVDATRQQNPVAGRFRYLGNLFSDITGILYRHADPKDLPPDPNAAHYTQGGEFDYPTLAYGENYIYALAGRAGTFEETGVVYETLEDFSGALARLQPQRPESGEVSERPLLRDPDRMDFRPTEAVASDGVLVFVPWGVARTVGEWQFTLLPADPTKVVDEHWFMTPAYVDRADYHAVPRHPLIGHGIDAESYTTGPLSNWTLSALHLNGEDQYLSIAHETLDHANPSIAVDADSFMIELHFRAESPDGLLVAKWANDEGGYRLELSDGYARLTLRTADGATVEIQSPDGLAEGEWHHLLAEYDRENQLVHLYVNGALAVSTPFAPGPESSLANHADFLVGGGPGEPAFHGALDFLRIALSTLAASRTSIGELYAWQFNGPQYKDFTGRDRREENHPGALLGD